MTITQAAIGGKGVEADQGLGVFHAVNGLDFLVHEAPDIGLVINGELGEQIKRRRTPNGPGGSRSTSSTMADATS
jgi:hypothetical protein